jgi:GAF domain-containing protein
MHVDRGALEAALDQLRHQQQPGSVVEPALERVVSATRGLFDVSGAGLLLVDEAQVLRYVVASDEAGRVLEAAHEQTGEGPCIDAFVLDRTVSTQDVESDDRWPRLTPLLLAAGVRSVLGAPVRLGGGPVGTLNVYVDHPYPWDESDRDAIGAFVSLVEGLLSSAVLAEQQSAIVGQLQYALDNRVLIDRAIGLLMGREGLDQVTAFDRLRVTARRSRRKVGEVARDLLEGRSPGDAAEAPRS